MDQKIAFNTANLVARSTGYRFKLENWGEQHKKTVASMNLITWAGICYEVAQCGFTAIEVWEAHAPAEVLDTDEKAEIWRTVLDDNGLEPVAMAGNLNPDSARICAAMGIPRVAGSSRGSFDNALDLCQKYRLPFNYENHAEKSAEEMAAKIDGGNKWMGIALDTGWLGTQALDAPSVIQELGPLIKHVHLKDVLKAGTHETCALGEGFVDLVGAIQALKEVGYTGWYSWEDEPEDRNPFESAVRNREWMEEHLDG